MFVILEVFHSRNRVRHANGLLRFSAAALPARWRRFDELRDRDAIAVLGRVPTPAEGTQLGLSAIRWRSNVLGGNAAWM